MPFDELDQLCINTVRTLAMDMVEQAKSGHPGMPMGAAAMAYVLWTRFLKHNPTDPAWPDRDRFVLSAGHGCALQYSLLHLTGYDLPLQELQHFRQWGSRTPGHGERGLTPGVEVTTGPLGQGFANGVGMAIAERMLAARFNRPGHTSVDHHTYAIVSDGDLMEGVASEAASLAGHLRLGRLICLYDDNHVTIEGSTALAFTEDVAMRFVAYGWEVQRADGNDLQGVQAALQKARSDEDRPSLIIARTLRMAALTSRTRPMPMGLHWGRRRCGSQRQRWAGQSMPGSTFPSRRTAVSDSHWRQALLRRAHGKPASKPMPTLTRSWPWNGNV